MLLYIVEGSRRISEQARSEKTVNSMVPKAKRAMARPWVTMCVELYNMWLQIIGYIDRVIHVVAPI